MVLRLDQFFRYFQVAWSINIRFRCNTSEFFLRMLVHVGHEDPRYNFRRRHSFSFTSASSPATCGPPSTVSVQPDGPASASH